MINVVGNKFFVKYYYQLRDMIAADIVDIIQEGYSFSEKQARINGAKNIFANGLARTALTQILQSNTAAVGQDLKDSALAILRDEFPNQSVDL
ncbi:MAG: hypothetical protein LBP26_00385 [Clostridiales bacterium]|nr:hypothetical protein [Clostridiales bacterium]